MNLIQIILAIYRGLRDLDEDHARMEGKLDQLQQDVDHLSAGLVLQASLLGAMDEKLDRILAAVEVEKAAHLIVEVGPVEEQQI